MSDFYFYTLSPELTLLILDNLEFIVEDTTQKPEFRFKTYNLLKRYIEETKINRVIDTSLINELV